MKLKNKKTGMIGEVGYISTTDGTIIVNNINDQDEWYDYASLAELNEEWEDYKEPKDIWWLDNEGRVNHASGDVNDSFRKNKKSATTLKPEKKPSLILFRVKDYEENDKDLDLLFGGEE